MQLFKSKIGVLLLEFLFIFFLMTLSIKADGYIGDSTGYNNGSTGGGAGNCTGKECYLGYEGIRVSLIRTDGTIQSANNYFFITNSNPNLLSYRYSWNSGQCNKVSYLLGIGKCSNKSASSTDKFDVFSFNSSFSRDLGWENPSLGNKVRTWNIPGLVSKFVGLNPNDPVDKAKLESVYQNIFDGVISTDPSNANYKTNEELRDYWIIIEPLEMVRSKSSGSYIDYYGTAYELATLNYGDKLTEVLNRVLPCTSIVTGTLMEKASIVPGIGDGSYFNGALNFMNAGSSISTTGRTLGEFCTTRASDTIDKKYVTGNYGMGMGLIWVGDLSAQTLTCEEAEAGYTSTPLKGMSLDNLNRLPATLSYTTTDNTVKFSRDWYIKQCTCYKVMDYYQSINNTSLGSKTKPQLETIFEQNSGIFKDYANKIIAEKPESDKDYGSVTPWTYANYIDRGCPYSARCTSVSFNNLKTTALTNEVCDYYYGWRIRHGNCKNSTTVNYFSFSEFTSPYYWYSDNYGYTYMLEHSMSKSKLKALLRDYGYVGDGYYKYSFNTILESISSTASCSNLKLFGDEGYTNQYIEDNKSKYNSCFATYNAQKGTSWTLDSYIADGCSPKYQEPPKDPIDCTPTYNVGTCLSGEVVYYVDESKDVKDDEYWENCVFNDNGKYTISNHKVSKPNEVSSNSYYDNTMGSKYCEVYCIEEMTSSFDTSVTNIYAGRYFSWNGHYASGSRTCKTKSIEWEQYESDIESNNNDIEEAYANWQLEIKKRANVVNHSTKASSASCSCIYNTAHNSCCSAEEAVYVSRTCSRKCNCTTDSEGKQSCESCSYDCSYYVYPCTAPNSVRYDLYTAAPTSFTLYADHTVNKYWGGTSWCSNSSDPVTASDVTNANNVYSNAVNIARGNTEAMEKCYIWNPENVYNISPVATVKYSDGFYSYEGELDTNVGYSMSNDNDCKTINKINYTSCSGTSCYKTGSINQCTYNDQTRSATASMMLREGIYQYISKFDNTAYCKGVAGCNKNLELVSNYSPNNYIINSNTNFPVAYKTTDGAHSSANSNGALDLIYSNLGHIKGGTTVVDNILQSVNRTDYTQWNCQFTVVSKLIPKDETINLVYRTVDLTNPFPNMDGQGRNTGFNWCSGYDCTNDNNVVKEIIINNRGVSSDEIYNKEPMYTFVLTPAIVNEIRKYNENGVGATGINETGLDGLPKVTYADYTGGEGNKFYDFKCNSGTGKTCISEYLTHLIEIAGATGTCTDPNARSYNNVSGFENCR